MRSPALSNGPGYSPARRRRLISRNDGTREGTHRFGNLSRAQHGDNLRGDIARALQFSRVKGNRSNARMPSAAEFFGEGREILFRGGLVPRICSERHLRTDGRGAHTDGVPAFGMQQVGNKFVVALEILIADVKKDDAVARIDALAQDFNRLPVTFEQWAEVPRHKRALDDFAQGTIGGFGNHLRRKSVFGGRSEEHTSELQSLAYLVCRLLHEKKNSFPTRRSSDLDRKSTRLNSSH